jgi:hypothetical protein
MYERLRKDGRFVTGAPPELDIVVWAPRGKRISDACSLTQRIFDEAARRHLHLALVTLPVHLIDVQDLHRDRDTIICLRSVLMKPEHLEWVDRIWSILDGATQAVVGGR